MFDKVLVVGKNDETLLPRVLRVLAKQGAQVRSLHMEAQDDTLRLEIKLADVVVAQVTCSKFFCNSGIQLLCGHFGSVNMPYFATST